ncbi:MAG: AAA family ATPase [Gloeomargaritaceae cyanobacterium C42_A2020_066]|nr:AAA family ATPase [Gloeomargaritaceae cyanobacterium C42_A2020_066]
MDFNPEKCRNETEVESKFVVHYLLPALGYPPDTWHQEVSLGSIRLDFLVFAVQNMPLTIRDNSPLVLVIEAKGPKQNLAPHVRKLRRYLTELQVPYGLLTNGKDFRIFERHGSETHLVFRCRGLEVSQKLPQIKALIGCEEMRLRQTAHFRLEQTQSVNCTPSPVPEVNPSPMLSVAKIEAQGEVQKSHAHRRSPQVSSSLIHLPEAPVMKTIAVYHNKGGVGKTTTVVNLAAAFRKRGKRVLIIDLDSQANTTFATGLMKFDDEADDTIKDCNVVHLLSSEDFYPIREVARPADYCIPFIDVVPAHINLMAKENDLGALDQSRMVLIQKLADVANDYDITIIDTPPALSLYARIALIAADYLIIPSDLKPFANQGLNNVKGLVKDVNGFRKMFGRPALQVLGVLASKVSTNAKFRDWTLPRRIQVIEDRYGLRVLDSLIFEREALAKCSESTMTVGQLEVPSPQSIFDFDPDSESAQEFERLAVEIEGKIRS